MIDPPGTSPAMRTRCWSGFNGSVHQSRGFRDYKVDPDVALDNGEKVDRISKRFDL